MTTAEVLKTPRPVRLTTVPEHDGDTLTLDEDPSRDHAPPEIGTYTAAEVLDVALAAYQRGRDDAASQAGRDEWAREQVVAAFRSARIAAELTGMRDAAASRYLTRGYPAGYDYKGGPVDYETGMPAGSGCAWLRRQRIATAYMLAGGGV